MSDHFDLLEMDSPSALRGAAPPLAEPPIELDLVDSKPQCLDCGASCAVNERSICEDCDGFGAAMQRDAAPVLQDIVAESSQNAAVQGAGSMRGGQLAGVGFTTAEGYITAIRNGVPARTHAEYLVKLRTSYGFTTQALGLLRLPDPMLETELPNGAGIVHAPTGPSIFDKPKAERAFVVGPAAHVDEPKAKITLDTRHMIAGAVAEGHGVLVGWAGNGRLTRGAIETALEGTGVKAPLAKGARAQAGRVMSSLTSLGYVVRIARDSGTKGTRWTVGIVNHTSTPGESMGANTMTAFLSPENELVCEGPTALCTKVQGDFRTLLDEEIYQSGDVTSWLGTVLLCSYDAVRFGVGWYVPAKHAEAAGKLCAAIAGTGWGADWILPALPVATSDQLRDGIVRGLVREVDNLVSRLDAERAVALATREAVPRDQLDVKLPRGDIGERRAATFLKDLRDIGQRIVAYGEVLGEERVEAARQKVRGVVAQLEMVLGDDYSGISARFSAVWDEIELDRKNAGGVL